jgi:hypothetical protein
MGGGAAAPHNGRFNAKERAMWPWMWINYAPNYRLAGTGDWAQQVDTNTVMEALTRSGSADPAVERKAIDIASYGRQLGWISDVLLGRDAEADSPAGRDATRSMQQLRVAHAQIGALKKSDPVSLAEAAATALLALLEADPGAYASLVAQAQKPPQRRSTIASNRGAGKPKGS